MAAWFPGKGEVYLGATPSNPRAVDVVPVECGQGEAVTDAEVREAERAREWRRAHGCMTSMDRVIEGFRNPPKLRHRRFGSSIPIR